MSRFDPLALDFKSKTLALGLCYIGAFGLMATPVYVSAQTINTSAAQFEKGYGIAKGQMEQSIDPSTRDANGNRILLDGVILMGADTSVYAQARSYGAADSFSGAGAVGGATAIGNNLQVIVNGNYNTVIVNSTQTNNGTVTATNNGVSVTATDPITLNGTLKF